MENDTMSAFAAFDLNKPLQVDIKFDEEEDGLQSLDRIPSQAASTDVLIHTSPDVIYVDDDQNNKTASKHKKIAEANPNNEYITNHIDNRDTVIGNFLNKGILNMNNSENRAQIMDDNTKILIQSVAELLVDVARKCTTCQNFQGSRNDIIYRDLYNSYVQANATLKNWANAVLKDVIVEYSNSAELMGIIFNVASAHFVKNPSFRKNVFIRIYSEMITYVKDMNKKQNGAQNYTEPLNMNVQFELERSEKRTSQFNHSTIAFSNTSNQHSQEYDSTRSSHIRTSPSQQSYEIPNNRVLEYQEDINNAQSIRPTVSRDSGFGDCNPYPIQSGENVALSGSLTQSVTHTSPQLTYPKRGYCLVCCKITINVCVTCNTFYCSNLCLNIGCPIHKCSRTVRYPTTTNSWNRGNQTAGFSYSDRSS